MAEQILEAEAPNSLAAAISELEVLQANYTTITKGENNHPFTECASFADSIKGQGYSFQADWHFIDQPYLIDGGDLDDFDFAMSDVDVHQALETLTAWLMNSGDYT
jgi:hypothetical protein